MAALNLASHAALAQIPAFPGASGPGAVATGGRGVGADVYHVTNLEFDVNGVIPGSFKYGINTAPAAGRTIVFDVGGTIFQNGGGANQWFRSGKSNITIAGQTAPGGITIAGVGSKWTGDNIILRNITVRPNQDPVNPTSFTYDGIATQATNSIISHVSVEWFTDEGVSATDAVHNTTVQYALIGEGLNYNGHSYGSIINTQNNDAPIGYHHNLYAHNNSRNPRLGSETGTGAIANFYNNVIYNWQSRAGYSALNADTDAQEPSRTNFINNFYARGANNGSTIFQSAGDQTQIYQSGNLYDGVRDADFNDAVPITWAHFSGTETQLANGLSVAAGAVQTATAGRDNVFAYVGANWWDRDATDQRVIDSVSAGTGSIINTVPTDEWNAVLAAPLVSRAASWDADGDGMPGYWEAAHGFDPDVASVGTDADLDGYSDLEEYLNDLAAWPAPGPIVYNGGNNQFARIQNWDVLGQVVNVAGSNVTTSQRWQPSRFDSAVIRTGVVLMNKVGQHAGTLQVAPTAGDSATLRVWDGWLRVEDTLSLGAAGTSGVLNMQQTGALHVHRITKGPGGAFQFLGGLLNADIVEFGITNSGGTISPDNSEFDPASGVIDFGGVDSMHVMGDLKINSGLIMFDIAGNQPGEYDFVDVDGKLTGGGTLEVTLEGYSPAAGDVFNLFDFGTSAGAFAFDLPDLGALLGWDYSQVLTTGELSVVALAVTENADFNGDEMVDGRDFLIWQAGLGSTGQTDNSAGDANFDGTVDADDLVFWETQYGSAPPALVAATTAVPEPGTGLMVSLWAGGCFCVARRRRIGTF